MNKLALFSVPRSGSSWLGEILNSSPKTVYKFQPNFAYSFESELKEGSSFQEIEEFYKKLLICEDKFVNGELSISGKIKESRLEKNKPTTLLFKETHFLNITGNLLKNSDTKIIGLVRSPLAVINSWLSIPKEFNPEWNIVEQWRTASQKNQNKNSHFFGYNKWKEVCFMFLELQKKYPDQFYLINYDDLIKEPKLEVQKMFEFCQLVYTSQTDVFIEDSTASQSKDAYAVFKQKKDDLAWQGTLPKFIEDEIKADQDFIKLNKVFNWL